MKLRVLRDSGLAQWALFLTILCVAFAQAAPSEQEPEWFGKPYISQDGTTLIKSTFCDVPGDFLDIGFFGADGSRRNVVRGRHGMRNFTVSPDGCLLLYGRVAGRGQTWFLSLYDAFGRLQWEYEPPPQHLIKRIAVSARGVMAAAVEETIENDARTERHVLLFGRDGKISQELIDPVNTHKASRYIGFAGNDRYIVAVTEADVHLYTTAPFNRLWSMSGLHFGSMTSAIGARFAELADEISCLAVIDRGEYAVAGKKRYFWRATVFDSKTGRLMRQQNMPIGLRTPKASLLSCNREKQVFDFQTMEGTSRVPCR
jgi:hypothetical protein